MNTPNLPNHLCRRPVLRKTDLLPNDAAETGAAVCLTLHPSEPRTHVKPLSCMRITFGTEARGCVFQECVVPAI